MTKSEKTITIAQRIANISGRFYTKNISDYSLDRLANFDVKKSGYYYADGKIAGTIRQHSDGSKTVIVDWDRGISTLGEFEQWLGEDIVTEYDETIDF